MVVSVPHRTDGASPRPGSGPRLVVVSTYPPTECGIATYTAALRRALVTSLDGDVGVVRLAGPAVDDPRPEVLGVVDPGDPAWPRSAARLAESADVVLLQHEFGLYGPDDGVAVLDLAEAVDAPLLATLHTVPLEPAPRRRFVLESLVERAEVAVVLSGAARNHLVAEYAVDPAKVAVVPHGADPVPPSARDDPRPLLLTWGLLRPGKGIEHAIGAVARLRHLDPPPHYLVAGDTHPRYATGGDPYRRWLLELIDRRGVGDLVHLRPGYLSRQELHRTLGAASLVVLPYVVRDQVTSGVLVEALAAGKPVVATDFPHAVEMLSGGAGAVVPAGDPDALAVATEAFLVDGDRYTTAATAARRLAADFTWSETASRYLTVVQRLVTT